MKLHLPGVTVWCWPRSFRHYWNRERAFDYEEPQPREQRLNNRPLIQSAQHPTA